MDRMERKPQKQLYTDRYPPPFEDSDNSISQGSSARRGNPFGAAEPKKIKFICNFGGAFLPRPSDGELRYIGGERHLVQISRDMSWHELTCTTRKLIRRDHTIKYHLPGEQLNMLISLTSQDDLRNMIDECILLQQAVNRARLTMYLFSADDDQHGVMHLLVARSSDADKEAHFIALVNGLAGAGPNQVLRTQSHGSTSTNDPVHHEMFPDESIFSIEPEPPNTSGGQQEKTLPTPSFLTRTTKRNKERNSQNNLNPIPITSGRKITGVHFDASVPAESMCAANREPGRDQAVSRHQQELQRTSTRAQEKESPRKELLTPLDKQTSSDNNKMKQEQGMCQSAGEPLSKNNKFQLQNKMGMSKSEHSSESAPSVQGHDHDDHHNLEKSVATKKQQPAVPITWGNTSKKDHPSNKPATNGAETVLSTSFTSSDNTTELKPSTLVRPSSERQQERPNSSRPDEQSSKMIKCRSVGADSSSPQIRIPSQGPKDRTTPLVSELEEDETKNSEQGLLKNAALGRGLTINVQTINNEDLEDLREMGSGAFGTVFHGKWRGTDVAIKRIKNSCFMLPSPQADKLIKEFWREAAIISKLHHPNILTFYGVVNNGPGAALATVTEFMVNGSLKKVLLRKDKYLDWRKRIMLAMDAAIGMEYLHSKDIVHFDLKCDNLLVNLKNSSRPICKVADFGLSKMKQATLVSGGMRGTLPWMAPELLTISGTKVSEQIDVYSFGIVMWEILTGEDPYDGMHYGGVIGGILSNTLRPPVPTSCNAEWRKLMEQCWSTEPERRPSFTEVSSRLRAILEATQYTLASTGPF